MDSKNWKNIAARIFSMLVAFGATFILTRIVVNKSGNELYGYYSMSADFVSYAAVLSIALNSMAGRYITVKYYEGDLRGVNRLFNTLIYANIGLSIALIVPLAFVINNL